MSAPDDVRALAVGRASLALLATLGVGAPLATASVDELVAFPFGLEANAARKLVSEGTLAAAKLGRKLYAKRSDVVALVDKLAMKPKRASMTVDVKASYAALASVSQGAR